MECIKHESMHVLHVPSTIRHLILTLFWKPFIYVYLLYFFWKFYESLIEPQEFVFDPYWLVITR